MPSYRNHRRMAEQMADLLRYYQEQDPTRRITAQEVLEIMHDTLWQQKIGGQQPEPPAITSWLWGRTSDGRKGWQPKLSDGTILDEIDEDVD